ncbi:DUF1254 domain-containing protein [Nocardia arthritidis]|uniref:DUF1254 domain-containing protein n=1 Tax=Nocardia arthritidis TaxID=228602 RepID=A0A6G9YBS8_9NOCA|nr:DUF1254 domain-containing protein [Nocardia arthritidis]QIS10662.1 DUF1254 domain-containing protein [Nocardia arthritidis]
MNDNGVGVSRRGFGLAAVSIAGLVACGKSSDNSTAATGTAESGDPRSIATDAYVFGYPLVLMDVTRAAMESVVPVNRFQHAVALPTPARRDVVRLNLDTLYSTAWLDLTAEPMVFQVPAMDLGRYWLMQLMDAWTNTVHNPSSVRPQAKSRTDQSVFTYAVTGPGWSGTLPAGITQLAMPTPMVWLVGRIQVNGPGDLPAVRAIQEQLKLVPLSAWVAGKEMPRPAPEQPSGPGTPAPQQVAQLTPRAFFDRMCALLTANPPAAADAPAMARFAKLGIRAGGGLTGIADADLAAVVDTARQRIPNYRDPKGRNENGWIFDPNIGAYGTDYPLRALVAWTGLGANLPQDAVYPTYNGVADANGVPNRFRLHFPPGQTPPVDAFWSLTAYDADSYLVPNPANIYAIGHQVPVVANPDGSLDLVIQNADPGPSVPAGNWLPIPAAGRFSLTMRLYAPKDAVLHGNWQPPGLTPAP